MIVGYSESYVSDESVNSLCFSTAPFLKKMHITDQSTSDAEQMTGHLSVSLCGNSHEL